jgi:hypothetical protein
MLYETHARLAEYKHVYEVLQSVNTHNPKASEAFCFLLRKPLTKKNYPELWKYKPWYVIHQGYGEFMNPFIGMDGYWFKPTNHKKRIKILAEIILNMSLKI